MGSSILELASEAAIDAGFERPTSLFGVYDEGDTTPTKMRRALTKTCQFLAATWDWQALRRERQFTSIGQVAQTGMIPADFLRFIDGTFWDRTSRYRVRGPIAPGEWQAIVSWQTGGMMPSFCQRGDDILLWPVPNAGRQLVFEYVANSIVIKSDGTQSSKFTADTDRTLWDDALIIAGSVMHYRELNRLDSANERMTFERLMHDRIKQDGGRSVINMGGRSAGQDRVADLRNQAIVLPGQGRSWSGSDW